MEARPAEVLLPPFADGTVGELDCILCCRLLWKPVTTPCGHTYCWMCLDRCLDYSSACPLCVTSLADVSRLFHRIIQIILFDKHNYYIANISLSNPEIYIYIHTFIFYISLTYCKLLNGKIKSIKLTKPIPPRLVSHEPLLTGNILRRLKEEDSHGRVLITTIAA